MLNEKSSVRSLYWNRSRSKILNSSAANFNAWNWAQCNTSSSSMVPYYPTLINHQSSFPSSAVSAHAAEIDDHHRFTHFRGRWTEGATELTPNQSVRFLSQDVFQRPCLRRSSIFSCIISRRKVSTLLLQTTRWCPFVALEYGSYVVGKWRLHLVTLPMHATENGRPLNIPCGEQQLQHYWLKAENHIGQFCLKPDSRGQLNRLQNTHRHDDRRSPTRSWHLKKK